MNEKAFQDTFEVPSVKEKTDLTEELEISNQNADNCTKIKLYIYLPIYSEALKSGNYT